MTITTASKRLLLIGIALLGLGTAGCMIEPFEGQHFASRSSPITFYGYVEAPNAPVNVYVQTWDDACGGNNNGYWQSLSWTVSSGTPLHDASGNAWYGWQLTATIPSNSWCLLPGPELGGLSYSTHVTGRYRFHISQSGSQWRTLFTSHENTVSCSYGRSNGFEMISECSRIGEPGADAVQIWAE